MTRVAHLLGVAIAICVVDRAALHLEARGRQLFGREPLLVRQVAHDLARRLGLDPRTVQRDHPADRRLPAFRRLPQVRDPAEPALLIAAVAAAAAAYDHIAADDVTGARTRCRGLLLCGRVRRERHTARREHRDAPAPNPRLAVHVVSNAPRAVNTRPRAVYAPRGVNAHHRISRVAGSAVPVRSSMPSATSADTAPTKSGSFTAGRIRPYASNKSPT